MTTFEFSQDEWESLTKEQQASLMTHVHSLEGTVQVVDALHQSGRIEDAGESKASRPKQGASLADEIVSTSKCLRRCKDTWEAEKKACKNTPILSPIPAPGINFYECVIQATTRYAKCVKSCEKKAKR